MHVEASTGSARRNTSSVRELGRPGSQSAVWSRLSRPPAECSRRKCQSKTPRRFGRLGFPPSIKAAPAHWGVGGHWGIRRSNLDLAGRYCGPLLPFGAMPLDIGMRRFHPAGRMKFISLFVRAPSKRPFRARDKSEEFAVPFQASVVHNMQDSSRFLSQE